MRNNTELWKWWRRLAARHARNLPAGIDGKVTPFRLRVWRETARIPFGSLESYGSLAGKIGRPGGARAVGQALGANPLPVIVPCHRVIASSGKLGGFSGGLKRKVNLLKREGWRVTRDRVFHDE